MLWAQSDSATGVYCMTRAHIIVTHMGQAVVISFCGHVSNKTMQAVLKLVLHN